MLGHLVLLLLAAVILNGEDQRVAGGGEGIRQNCIVENVLKRKTLFHFRLASCDVTLKRSFDVRVQPW